MEHKTVFVGLSGGVDSSVAAWRLLQQGYRVVGVFIKVWHPEWLVCNWEAERLDAMRVAAHLKIPFLTCDAVDAYRDEVAEYFITSYREGRTPNPDVLCNRAVKFGAFLEFARVHGADFIATGHYAQCTKDNAGFHLLRGVDESKDQSYFLWTLTQSDLEQVLLPIGDTKKSDIRNEANRAGIPTAAKKDSQGICFLGEVDIASFLSHYIDLVPGPVLDLEGNTIGEHAGAFIYTIGQRHGFTLRTASAARQPYYVVAKDVAKNTITVAAEPPQLQVQDSIRLTNISTVSGHELNGHYSAQFRYRQAPLRTLVEHAGAEATVTLEAGVDLPASGQSCVLYDGDELVGGGIIA